MEGWEGQDDPAWQLTLPIRRLPGNEDLPLPRAMSEQAAGLDLVAAVPEGEPVHLAPGTWARVPCGISLALPAGWEAQVRPRSGLAWRHGVTLLDAPGTIDADYRGEIQVVLVNFGRETFIVRRGDRVAQLVVARVARVRWHPVSELPPSQRGAGGFGHTGV